MYCHNCGNKVDDGLKFCPECGTRVVSAENPVVEQNKTETQTDFTSESSTELNSQDKSFITKKIIALIAVSVAAIILIVVTINMINSCVGLFSPNTLQNNDNYGYDSDDYEDYNADDYENDYSDDNNSSGAIGDFYVEIGDYRMSKTTSGDPLIVITYSFTNNSDESASFTMSLDDKVYQNGMEIDQEFFGLYDDDVDNTVAGRDIKPGVKISFEAAYSLDNEYDDVEVEVGSMFDFSGDSKKVSKTFVID